MEHRSWMKWKRFYKAHIFVVILIFLLVYWFSSSDCLLITIFMFPDIGLGFDCRSFLLSYFWDLVDEVCILLIGRWGSLCVFWNCTLCGWKLRPCIRVLSSLGKLSSVLLPTWTAHIVENRVMNFFRLKKYKFYEYFLADYDQSLSGKIIFERENWRMEVFFTEWISACIKIYISHIYANIYGT